MYVLASADQGKEEKKKNDDIQLENGRSGPKVNPHRCCFPASDCRSQLPPSSNPEQLYWANVGALVVHFGVCLSCSSDGRWTHP